MSVVPHARKVLTEVKALVNEALALMTREKPIKRTKPRRVVITETIRRRVRVLARQGKSHHEIADIVGLPNGGRVSEILNGKR